MSIIYLKVFDFDGITIGGFIKKFFYQMPNPIFTF
jgi:hypothetical protein